MFIVSYILLCFWLCYGVHLYMGFVFFIFVVLAFLFYALICGVRSGYGYGHSDVCCPSDTGLRYGMATYTLSEHACHPLRQGGPCVHHCH